MKRRRVVYAPAAGEDLAWIYDVVAAASTSSVASRYEQRIRQFCAGLEFAAERGVLRADLRPGLRVVGFERSVTVAFAVDEDVVTILRIFYGGRDWEGDF